ncbi:MAG: SPASM domain-containing protein [Deltaproteobacteria bacterium]|nr:SPASM domain-containing protein [Deltaproteobacteria bacterium]
MCAHPIMPRRNQHMDQGLYEKIITELALHRDQLKVLSLHFMGEPLMDPLIFERIKIAKQAGIQEVQFNTNTQLLTPEKARLLLESGIDAITFSLGGLDKESQDKRRIGTISHVVEQNIDYVIDLIDSYGNDRKKPKKFIYTIKNSSQDKAYLPIMKKYKNKVDGIAVVNQNNWGGESKNHEKDIHLTSHLIPCPFIFSEMLINVNGKVNLCCIDYADREIMGDVSTSSLYDIWNGQKMEAYRLLHLKKKSDRIALCSECTIFR